MSDFSISFERNNEGYLFAHCLVTKYNKTIKNEISLAFKKALSCFNDRVCLMATDSEKTKKFVKLFGFEYLTTKDGLDVFIYKR